MPETMSRTSAWAPKPMAMPTTPAPASNGPMSTPSDDTMIMPTMVTSVMKRNLRTSGRRVCSRDSPLPVPSPSARACGSIASSGACRLMAVLMMPQSAEARINVTMI